MSWLNSEDYAEAEKLTALLDVAEAVLPAAVVSELYSGVASGPDLATVLTGYHILPIQDGYWMRTGLLRADMRRRGRKGRLGDALIAQACIDAGVPLLTRDADFRAFAEISGLKLA